MNSTTFLQQVCSNWLMDQDQSALTAQGTEALIAAANGAVNRVWRKLPAHYRRKTLSVGFDASASGTIAATAGSRTATFTITGTPQANQAREFCTVEAGTVRNEYRAGALLHPWQDATGTHAVTLHHDATIKLGYLVDRVLSPMHEVRGGDVWRPVPAMESARLWTLADRYYDIQLVSFATDSTLGSRTQRTLFRVAKHTGPLLFEAVVQVVPEPLSLVDSVVPVDLYYDDEVANLIAQAAGIELQRHPRFRGGNLDLAIQAMDAVRAMPQSFHSTPNQVGTPDGW